MDSRRANDPTIDDRAGVSATSEREVNGTHPDGASDEPDLDGLLAYLTVPLRPVRTVSVRYTPGGRLRPLPYPLDEEADS